MKYNEPPEITLVDQIIGATIRMCQALRDHQMWRMFLLHNDVRKGGSRTAPTPNGVVAARSERIRRTPSTPTCRERSAPMLYSARNGARIAVSI